MWENVITCVKNANDIDLQIAIYVAVISPTPVEDLQHVAEKPHYWIFHIVYSLAGVQG